MSRGRRLLGVDPGVGGGLAWVEADGQILDACPMPIQVRRQNGRDKKFICCDTLHELCARYVVDEVWIEDVHSSPQMGVTSAFNFGRGVGSLEGVAACWWPLQARFWPHPSVWKPSLGVPADKKRTIERAVFPKAGGILVTNAHAIQNVGKLLKKHKQGKPGRRVPGDFHDGMVEAALIATYGHRATPHQRKKASKGTDTE